MTVKEREEIDCFLYRELSAALDEQQEGEMRKSEEDCTIRRDRSRGFPLTSQTMIPLETSEAEEELIALRRGKTMQARRGHCL